MLMSSASGAMPWKVSSGEGCAPMMLAMRVPWWSQSSRPFSHDVVAAAFEVG